MRLNSGQVRAVLVDEPSSALDAEGELALFDNLRAEREGKTMIFVTHRFGHLTKYADQIMYVVSARGSYNRTKHSTWAQMHEGRRSRRARCPRRAHVIGRGIQEAV